MTGAMWSIDEVTSYRSECGYCKFVEYASSYDDAVEGIREHNKAEHSKEVPIEVLRREQRHAFTIPPATSK